MPTDEQRAMWAAIRADPDADTPRLVYADWCDEHGDPARAEFIRVQCRLAALPGAARNGPSARAAKQRERELARRHGYGWVAAALDPIADLPHYATYTTPDRAGPGQHFCRGFLHRLTLTIPEAARLAEAGDAVEPVADIGIYDLDREREGETAAALGRVARSPFSRVVRTVHILGPDDRLVAQLVDGGRWGRVVDLVLHGGRVGDDGAARLAGSPLLAWAEALFLSENRIGDAGAAALAASPYLNNVYHLFLSHNLIGPDGVARLRGRFGEALRIGA